VKRSAAEIFIEDKEILLLNSKGLELEEKRTEILVDFVLLAEKGPLLEGEGQGSKKAVFFDDLNLAETMDHYAAFSRESLEAVLPRSGLFPVIFSEEALDSLFHFFCLQASGPGRFQNWSHFRVGYPVIEELQGEALTLSSNPTLPGGLKTRSFDDNGLPLHPVRVIDENIFQNPMNSKRYADYLNEKATGDFSNLEVASGSTLSSDLLTGAPCFHLLRFSHFEPNPVTGAFSAEIRTGYYLMNGRKMPIKGGSVSGTMQQAFKKAFFSRERTRREAYSGPRAVRIEPLTISGS
ncbi:MAG: metallopeptidase TldD-related protein, partial [Thermodesulfobacteriota bacterium]